jgi:hypothetical protein
MASRLAIYWPGARIGVGANLVGVHVAKVVLFRALARYGGFERLDVLSHATMNPAELAEDLLDGDAAAGVLVPGSALDVQRLPRSMVPVSASFWTSRTLPGASLPAVSSPSSRSCASSAGSMVACDSTSSRSNPPYRASARNSPTFATCTPTRLAPTPMRAPGQ